MFMLSDRSQISSTLPGFCVILTVVVSVRLPQPPSALASAQNCPFTQPSPDPPACPPAIIFTGVMFTTDVLPKPPVGSVALPAPAAPFCAKALPLVPANEATAPLLLPTVLPPAWSAAPHPSVRPATTTNRHRIW